jgi:protein-S-isoprenylcysteine O-methyltransferase Ste14
MNQPDRGPGVPFPPPILFVGALAIAFGLERFAPLGAMPGGVPREGAGVALAAIGLGTVFTGILTFRHFRTAIMPNKPATLVVDRGIYARTRNPMYLGLTVFYVGIAAVLASWWAIALLPAVLLLLSTQVIAREERYLRGQFPAAYVEYCARVRRWL